MKQEREYIKVRVGNTKLRLRLSDADAAARRLAELGLGASALRGETIMVARHRLTEAEWNAKSLAEQKPKPIREIREEQKAEPVEDLNFDFYDVIALGGDFNGQEQ